MAASAPADPPAVAVVGAGIVGLSTAYALRERGARVTLYERGLPGNDQSAGETRIFRHAHGDRRLVALARRSGAVYDAWSAQLGVPLLDRDGEVTLGEDAEDHLALVRDAGVRAHALETAELRDRLPILAGYDGFAMVDEEAATIRARAAVEALAGAVADALVPEEVFAVAPDGDGVVVEATGGTRRHDRAVVCASRSVGPLARGLGLSLPVLLGVQVRLTFPLRDGGSSPCFQDDSGAFGEKGIYGLPDRPGRYAVGLTDDVPVHPDGSLVDPGGPADRRERIRDHVRRALPGLAPDPVDERQCWVTKPTWSDSGLAVWEAGGVLLLAGHHLFKHAPGLGRSLAAAAVGDGLDPDLRPEATLGAPS